MSIALKRSYNIYVSKSTSSPFDNSNTVQLLVRDFSFNTSSILDRASRETIDPNQERTTIPFIQSIAPVSFSFSTYILPLVDTNVTSPEEYLWTSLMGNDSIAGSPNSTPTSSTIDFAEGNVGTLHELTLWFHDPNNSDVSYRINNAIIDSARISFDINGIAMIEWQGRALEMTRVSFSDTSEDRTNVTSYLKNRLSTITMELATATTYTVALTGGSINIDNNVQFYGRSKIGQTTTPVGHYTGNRDITGNLNFYLKAGTNFSADLYETLLINSDSTIYESQYSANITINIGGTTTPYIEINVPRAILEIPRLRFDETVSMDVPFTAKEGTGNYSTITYYA